MRFLYIILFIILITQPTLSQSYTADRIRYKGEVHQYYYHHLEQYLKSNPSKRPTPMKDGDLANRGYIAEFLLENDLLYLTNVFITTNKSGNPETSIKEDILGKNTDKIPMYWINGLYDFGIGISTTNPKDNTPMFENYIILEVKRGRVTRYNQFNQKQMERFKSYQWDQFYNTTNYKKVYQQLQKIGMPEEDIKNHIHYHVIFYSKKNYILQ